MNYYLLIFFLIFSASVSGLLYSYFKRRSENKILSEHIPFVSSTVYTFFLKLRMIKAAPITKSFVNAISILKNTVSKNDYKYSVPWYLVLGPEGAGKSSILENLNDLLVPGVDKEALITSVCQWFLYTNALAVEISSSVFDITSASKKINNNWQLLANLFCYYRPRKPLDGIVLTIPYDIIAGTESYPGAYKTMAQNIFDNIWWMQQKINIRVPIYIIITKFDQAKGVNELMTNLNVNEKDQIFGWSSVYGINEAYSPIWVDEAIGYISNVVNELILKIAVRSLSEDTYSGILSVPYEINNITDNLKLFTNTLFAPHDRFEGLMLRGIYFSASENNNDFSKLDLSLLNAEKSEFQVLRRNGALNFIKDLFCEKIFLESNIAKPIVNNAFHNSRFVFIKRFLYVSIIVFLFFGFLFDFRRIESEFNKLGIYIHEINLSVKKLKTKFLKKPINLDKELRNTLTLMSEIKINGIKSIFTPISFFYDIESDIKKVISDSFDTAIINSIYSDLKYKINDIDKKIAEINIRDGEVYEDLFALEEFHKLTEYVKKVIAIQEVEDQYNSLLHRDNGTYINTITNFLFSEQFNVSKFLEKRIKTNTNHPTFSITEHKEIIQENIKILFSNFIKAVFPKIFSKIFENITISINNISDQLEDIEVNLDIKELLDLYNKLGVVISFITSKTFEWMSGNSFNPGGNFLVLKKELSKIKVLDNLFIQKLQNFADQSLIIFKNSLMNYKTVATGPILKRTKNIIAMCPSSTCKIFYNELGELLKEPFMLNINKTNLLKIIPNTKLLYWNQDMIKQASVLVQHFINFKSSKLINMSAQNRTFFLEISKRILRGIIYSLVAKSQNLKEISSDDSVALSLLIDNVNNLSEVESSLFVIMDFLSEEFSYNKSEMFSLFRLYYIRVLSDLDKFFEKNTPFDFNQNIFDTWNGDVSPNKHMLNVTENDQVKEYIDVQISSLQNMAKLVAEPVNLLLKSKYLKVSGPDEFLIDKWNNIIKFVNEYISKKPGNSVSLLENFIYHTLSEVNLNNFDEVDFGNKYVFNTKDFFLMTRAKIASALYKRVKVIKQNNVLDKYNQIAEFFNNNLSGRFPFVKFANIYTEDVEVDKVIEFLSMIKSFDNNFRKTLAKLKNVDKTNSIKDVENFINNILDIKELLEAFVSHVGSGDENLSKLTCSVSFFSMRDQEVGYEQILISKMIFGGIELNSFDSNKNTACWIPGDDIHCIFQWAMNSYELPYMSKNPLLTVDGQEAIFKYSGKWGLLRLINSNKVSGSTYPSSGVILKFDIPTIDKKTGKHKRNAKILIRLKVQLSTESGKYKYISIPSFPFFAPKIFKSNFLTKKEK